MAMTIKEMSEKYPVGTVIRLRDDYPGETHTIEGYKIRYGSSYLLFSDNRNMSTERECMIAEIICTQPESKQSEAATGSRKEKTC